jgi:eukaryotic-like serine/threonine-protein kinase
VAENGTLVYMPAPTPSRERNRSLVWVSREGSEEPAGLSVTDAFGAARISPDGTRVLRDGGTIQISDVSRPAWLPLIEGRNQWGATWSRDGRHIVFSRDNKVMQTRADGTHEEELFTSDGNQLLVPGAWSPDGRYVTFTYGTQIAQRLGLLDLERLAQDEPWRLLVDGASSGAIAPDGAWIAYQSIRSGDLHVYVDRFPDVGDPTRVSTAAGGGHPVWSANGRELIYRRPDGATMAVTISRTPAFTIGEPVVLFEDNGYGRPGGSRSWDIAPDGRFLMVKERTPATAGSLVVVQNWSEELQRQAAAR